MLLQGIACFCARQILCGWTAEELPNTATRRKFVRLLYFGYLLFLSYIELVLLLDQKIICHSITIKAGLVANLLTFICKYSVSNFFNGISSLPAVLGLLIVSAILLSCAAAHILACRAVANIKTLNKLNQSLASLSQQARNQNASVEDETVSPLRLHLLRPEGWSKCVFVLVKWGDILLLLYFWIFVQLCIITKKTYTQSELVAANAYYINFDPKEWFSLPLESYDATVYVTRLSDAIQFGGASHIFSLCAGAVSLAGALIIKLTNDWLTSAYTNPLPNGQSGLAKVASVKQDPAAPGEVSVALAAIGFRALFWYAGVLTEKHVIYLDSTAAAARDVSDPDQTSDTLAYLFGPILIFATIQLFRAVKSPCHVDFRANTLMLMRNYLFWLFLVLLMIYLGYTQHFSKYVYEILVIGALVFSLGFKFLSSYVVQYKLRTVPTSLELTDESLLSCIIRLLAHIRDRTITYKRDQADLDSKDLGQADLELSELCAFMANLKLKSLQLGSDKLIGVQSHSEYAKSASRWLQNLSLGLTQTKPLAGDRSQKEVGFPVPDNISVETSKRGRRRSSNLTAIRAAGLQREGENDSIHDRHAKQNPGEANLPGLGQMKNNKGSKSLRKQRSRSGTRLSVNGVPQFATGDEIKSSDLPTLKNLSSPSLPSTVSSQIWSLAMEGVFSLPSDTLDPYARQRLGKFAGLVQLISELLAEKIQLEMGRSRGSKWDMSSQYMSVFSAVCLNFTNKPALAYSYIKEYKLRSGMIGQTSVSKTGVKVLKSEVANRLASWTDFQSHIDSVASFYSNIKGCLQSSTKRYQRRNSRVNTSDMQSPKLTGDAHDSSRDGKAKLEHLNYELPLVLEHPKESQQSNLKQWSVLLFIDQFFRLLLSNFFSKIVTVEILLETISLCSLRNFDDPAEHIFSFHTGGEHVNLHKNEELQNQDTTPLSRAKKSVSIAATVPDESINFRQNWHGSEEPEASYLVCLYGIELLEQAKHELMYQMLQRIYFLSGMRVKGIDLPETYTKTARFLNTHQRATQVFKDLEDTNAKYYTPALITRVNYLGFVLQDMPSCKKKISELMKKRFSGDLRLLRMGKHIAHLGVHEEQSMIAVSLEKDDFNIIRSVSENVTRFLEYIPAELIGTSLDTLVPKMFQQHHNLVMEPKNINGQLSSKAKSSLFPIVRRNGSIRICQVLVRIKSDLRFGLEACALVNPSPGHAEAISIMVDDYNRVICGDSHASDMFGLGKSMSEISLPLSRGLVDTLEFCKLILRNKRVPRVEELYQDPILLEQAKKYYELRVGGILLVKNYLGELFKLRVHFRPVYLFRTNTLVRFVTFESANSEEKWPVLTRGALSRVEDISNEDMKLFDAVQFAQKNLKIQMESIKDLAEDPEYLIPNGLTKSYAFGHTGVIGSVHNLLGGAFATVSKAVEKVGKRKGPVWLNYCTVNAEGIANLINGFLNAKGFGPAVLEHQRTAFLGGVMHPESPSLNYKLMVNKASQSQEKETRPPTTQEIGRKLAQEDQNEDQISQEQHSIKTDALVKIEEVSDDQVASQVSQIPTSGLFGGSRTKLNSSKPKGVESLSQLMRAPQSEKEVDQASVSSIEGSVKERRRLRHYLDRVVQLEKLHEAKPTGFDRVTIVACLFGLVCLFCHLLVGTLGFISQYECVLKLLNFDWVLELLSQPLWSIVTLGSEHAILQFVRQGIITDDYLNPIRMVNVTEITSLHKSFMVGYLLKSNTLIEGYISNYTAPILMSNKETFDQIRPLRCFMASLGSQQPRSAFAPPFWKARSLNQMELTRYIQPILDAFLLTEATVDAGIRDTLTNRSVYDETWEFIRANLHQDYLRYHLDRYWHLRKTYSNLRKFMVNVIINTHTFGISLFVAVIIGSAVVLCVWRSRQIQFFSKLFRLKIPDVLLQELILDWQLQFLTKVVHSEWLTFHRHRLFYLDAPFEGSAKYEFLKLFVPVSAQHLHTPANYRRREIGAEQPRSITKAALKPKKPNSTKTLLHATQNLNSKPGLKKQQPKRTYPKDLQNTSKFTPDEPNSREAQKRNLIGQPQLHHWNKYVTFAVNLGSDVLASWSGGATVLGGILLCALPLIALNLFVILSENKQFVQASNALSVLETASDWWTGTSLSTYYLLQMLKYNNTAPCGKGICSEEYLNVSSWLKQSVLPTIEAIPDLALDPSLQNVMRESIRETPICNLIREYQPDMPCGSGSTAHLQLSMTGAMRGINSVQDEAYQLGSFYTTSGETQAIIDVFGNMRMESQIGINVNGALYDYLYYYMAVPAAKAIKRVYQFDVNTSQVLEMGALSGSLTYDSRISVFIGLQCLLSCFVLLFVWQKIVPILQQFGFSAKTACLLLPYQLVVTNPLLSNRFNE